MPQPLTVVLEWDSFDFFHFQVLTLLNLLMPCSFDTYTLIRSVDAFCSITHTLVI